MSRSFRFAIQAFSSTSLKSWVDLARKVEASGFSTLHVADHLLGPGSKIEGTGHRVQQMALIPALTSAAMATTTLRVGSRMACVSYHLPTVLTKEMATVDLLSEGRLELGLGAGWLVNEYEAMGIPFESAGQRIRLLRETVEFMQMAYRDEAEVDYHGEFINSAGYHSVPVPVQRPWPPIMIGGGAPKVLGLAGELADIVSVNFNNSSGVVGAGSITSSTEDETHKKIDWIKAGAGDRFDQLELETATYFISIEGRSEITAEAVMSRTGLDLPTLKRFPHAAVGSVDEICEELIRRREEYGFSYITVGDAHLDAFIPIVDRLAGT